MLVEKRASVRQPLALVRDRGSASTGVSSAGPPREARRLLAEKDVDVAILDLHLPDGDGNDLIREIRASNPSPRC